MKSSGSINKTKYSFIWSDHEPNIFIEANINSFIKFSTVTPWNDVTAIIQVSNNNDIRCFHSIKDLKADSERGKSLLNKKFTDKLLGDLQCAYSAHWQMFREIRKRDIKALSDNEILAWIERIINEWSHIISYFRYSQAEGTHHLVEEIYKHYSQDEASTLMLPAEIDNMNLELLDWQRIIKTPFSRNVILNHVAKYPWLAMNHVSYEDVLETLKQRYEYDRLNLVPKNIAKEKIKLKEQQRRIMLKYPKIKPLIILTQKIAVSRIAIKSCWAGSDFYLIPFYQEISKRTHESISDLWKFYLLNDIKRLVIGKKPLPQKEKLNRKKCFVGQLRKKRFVYYSGAKAEEVAKKELGSLYKAANTDILRGTPANPGKRIGLVRILRTNDVENTRYVRKTFKKGEILVTQMTQPNVMDIASKAAAIVTDEGGMLSHAAIISREPMIPCIVGTHYATRVLKDGDMVEVDANAGIVKKI